MVRNPGLFGTSCAIEDLSAPCASTTVVNNEQHILTNLKCYKNCSFTVSIDYIQCIDFNGVSSVFIGDYRLTGIGCPKFIQDLNNAQQAGSGALEQFITDFNLCMYRAIEEILITPLAPYCSTGNYSSVKWVLNPCVYYCFRGTLEGQSTEMEAVVCGEGCCFIATSYCRNPDGSLHIETTSIPTVPSTCVSTGPPIGGPVCDFTTLCLNRCE